MGNLRESEVYFSKEYKVPYSNYLMGNVYQDWAEDIFRNEAYREFRRHLKQTRKPAGYKISLDKLKEMKDKDLASKERFAYCRSCPCRWGLAGL